MEKKGLYRLSRFWLRIFGQGSSCCLGSNTHSLKLHDQAASIKKRKLEFWGSAFLMPHELDFFFTKKDTHGVFPIEIWLSKQSSKAAKSWLSLWRWVAYKSQESKLWFGSLSAAELSRNLNVNKQDNKMHRFSYYHHSSSTLASLILVKLAGNWTDVIVNLLVAAIIVVQYLFLFSAGTTLAPSQWKDHIPRYFQTLSCETNLVPIYDPFEIVLGNDKNYQPEVRIYVI